MSASRLQLGGICAIAFLAALGGLAFYSQKHSYPQSREFVRNPVAIVSQETVKTELAPPPLPWNERLDLSAIKIRTLDLSKPKAQEPIKGKSSVPLAKLQQTRLKEAEAHPKPEDGLYVQDLNDGYRVLYTLDPVLQRAAATIFRNREVPYAAAVMLDLRDNAVLALVGHSTVDPKVDPLEIVATPWAPAASVFKLVTACSLLEHRKATTNSRACFSGGLHGITESMLKDEPSRDRRCETLSSAIAYSHNLVVAKLALKHLDQAMLRKTATSLFFDADIPFEFPIERSVANIPEEANARAKVAAGFWHVEMSPIHGAVLASIIARQGTYQPPHIVASVVDPNDRPVELKIPKEQTNLPRSVATRVGKMMVGTTESGTARASFRERKTGISFTPGISVAGKTGSLTGSRAPGYNYNWFVGFFPAQAPEVAIAVVLANAPKWRIKAHYAARRLIQIHTQRKDFIQRNRQAILKRDRLYLPSESDVEDGALSSRKQESQNEHSLHGLSKSRDSRKRSHNDKSKGNAPSNGHSDGGSQPSNVDEDEVLPPIPGSVPKK